MKVGRAWRLVADLQLCVSLQQEGELGEPMAEACTHFHPTQQLVLLLRRPESASAWLKRSEASCTRCAARWGCLWQLHAVVAPMQCFARVLVHGTCLRCGCVHWPAISPRILVQAGRLEGEA